MKIAKISVEYVDHMGSDLSVVNAARVSFNKESGFVDGELPEKDSKLIRYLAKHNHWSPFAHSSIQLRLKVPIFVIRQLAKHQVGGVINEVSRRYVDYEPEFWFPENWRSRPDSSMKQGSGENLDQQEDGMACILAEGSAAQSLASYQALLSKGVAPEMARMILPQNMMTEFFWTGSLMFFARVCRQRLDSHAQKESQEVAQMISEVVQPLFPVSWEYLV